MAKFLRVIFNLLLILYIVAALALFVPPLVGVTTAVTMDSSSGNQAVGSVSYAWRTPLASLKTGDEILATDGDAVNVYPVKSVDTEQKIITAADADSTQIAVRSYAYKLLLTVPYLGYISIYMQTTEGMITLAAVAGILLILCILTAIWCRKRKIKRMREEEEDLLDEEDNEFFRDLASQKVESDMRAEEDYRARRERMAEQTAPEISAPALDEEYEEFPQQSYEKEEPAVQVTEAIEEAFDEEDPQTDAETEDHLTELSEIESAIQEMEIPETEEAASSVNTGESMAVERAVSTGSIPGVQAALEAALDTQQIQRHVRRTNVVQETEEEAEAQAAEEIELAMPVYTVDEYLQKAYSAGLDPVVKKDELTGVTYIDFSECV